MNKITPNSLNKHPDKPLYIFGAGGHTHSLLLLIKDQKIKVTALIDQYVSEVKILDYGIIKKTPTPNYQLIIGIGDVEARIDLYQQHSENIYKPNLIHSTATIASSAKLGNSNQIFTHTLINNLSTIGNHNIINNHAIIEHDVTIGNHNHIGPGAVICGFVNIGSLCFIGAGATVINGVSICDQVTIGAGATVTKNIARPGVYVGTPAKLISNQTK